MMRDLYSEMLKKLKDRPVPETPPDFENRVVRRIHSQPEESLDWISWVDSIFSRLSIAVLFGVAAVGISILVTSTMGPHLTEDRAQLAREALDFDTLTEPPVFDIDQP